MPIVRARASLIEVNRSGYPDGSYVSPAHVPFASEVLAKVRTFDGLIGALEQFD